MTIAVEQFAPGVVLVTEMHGNEQVSTPITNGFDSTGRYCCLPGSPWTPDKSQRAWHPYAEDVGECREGCCDDFRCPVCGHEWRVEAPT